MGLSTELKLRRKDFSDDELDEFIDLIVREAQNVANTVDDLLIAARATAESITVIPEHLELDEIVNGTIATLPAEIHLRLVDCDIAATPAYADPVRLRQIIRNLITNGQRHGGRHIRVRTWRDGDTAVLEVSDDGEGIPLERRERVFDAYEASAAESGLTASIGLGLTVSRQLARLMDGDVTYRHEPRPTFRLELPVRTRSGARALQAPAEVKG